MAETILYLSDGGYSRLYGYFDEADTFGYRLGTESREAVKTALSEPAAQAMLEAITTEINEQIQEMES